MESLQVQQFNCALKTPFFLLCTQATVEGEFTIFVETLQSEIFIFKFWQDETENGVPIY